LLNVSDLLLLPLLLFIDGCTLAVLPLLLSKDKPEKQDEQKQEDEEKKKRGEAKGP